MKEKNDNSVCYERKRTDDIIQERRKKEERK